MIEISLGGNRYRFPASPAELSVSRAVKIRDMACGIPNGGSELEYRLFALAGGLSESLAIKVEPDELKRFFAEHLVPLVRWTTRKAGCRYPVEESFEWRGDRVWLPRSGMDDRGNLVPLAKVTAGVFCEVSDLCFSDWLLHAPVIARKLCYRESMTVGDDDNWADADMMPLSLAIELSGRIVESHRFLARRYPLCYADGDQREKDNTLMGRRSGIASDWCGFLFRVGGYRPADVAAARQMNCDDFFRLATAQVMCRKSLQEE